MAIAFDNSAVTATPVVSGTSYSYTTSGSNRLLFIGLGIPFGQSISGVTYAGVSMTQQAMLTDASNYNIYLFYLVNPALGANNYVVTASSSTQTYGCVASYNGVSQTGFPDASTTNQNTGTSQTVTLTTIANNAWTFMFSGFNYGQVGTPTGGTGTTIRQALQKIFIASDSNGAITPAGSTSLILNNGTSGSQNDSIMVSFAPVAAANKGSFFLFM